MQAEKQKNKPQSSIIPKPQATSAPQEFPDLSKIPDSQLLNYKFVKFFLGGVSDATTWRYEKRGILEKPILIGRRKYQRAGHIKKIVGLS